LTLYKQVLKGEAGLLFLRDDIEVTVQRIVGQVSYYALRPQLPLDNVKISIGDTGIRFQKHIHHGRLDPFHDRKAMDIALQIATYSQPDIIVLNGDILDFTEWTDKFAREPEFYFTTQPALFEAHWWIAQLRQACPDSQIVYIAGNHEVRLPFTITTHLLAAHQLLALAGQFSMPTLDLPTLLDLEGLGVEYVANYPEAETFVGPARCTHGNVVKGRSPKTVDAILQKANDSTIIGHIHRAEMATKIVRQGGKDRLIWALCPGALCRLDYVVPGHTLGQSWNQGIAEIVWDEEDVYPALIPIHQGRAIYQGLVFEGSNRLQDLNEDITASHPEFGWKY
jgi:hypothetical protein